MLKKLKIIKCGLGLHNMSLSFILIAILVAGCSTQPPASVLSLYTDQLSKTSCIVKPKDTIYSIAKEQRIDHLVLARINKIPPPFTIYVGQRLLLRANSNKTAQNVLSVNKPITRNTKIITQKNDFPVKVNSSVKAQNVNYGHNFTQDKKAINTANTTNVTETKNVTAKTKEVKSSSQGSSVVLKRLNWIWPAKGPILTRFFIGAAKKNGINIGGNEGTSIKAVAAGKVVYSGSGLRGYGNLIIIKHANNFLSAYAHNRKNMVKEGVDVKIGQQIAEMGKTGTNKVMLHFEIRHNGKPVDPEKVLPKR